MKFCKMHGLGNDFIVIENVNGQISLCSEEILSLCHRRFGIGADGLMLVNPSDIGHIKMSYYNSDGGEVEMCGNGIRCFAKYVYDHHIVRANPMNIETLAGIKTTALEVEEDKVSKVRVDMGPAIYESRMIPIDNKKEYALQEKIQYKDRTIEYAAVSMGNPHVVILVEDIDQYPIEEVGSFMENHPIFPKKTNVNFVEIVDFEHIKVITWERGAGLTLACGTGTCASVAIANGKGLVGDRVHASLPGGTLIIELKDRIYMTGEAVAVFDGEIERSTLKGGNL